MSRKRRQKQKVAHQQRQAKEHRATSRNIDFARGQTVALPGGTVPYDPHVPLDNAAAYLSSVHAEATREIVRALKNPASPHAEEQAQWRKPQQGSAEYDDGAVVATELYDEESVAEDEEEAPTSEDVTEEGVKEQGANQIVPPNPKTTPTDAYTAHCIQLRYCYRSLRYMLLQAQPLAYLPKGFPRNQSQWRQVFSRVPPAPRVLVSMSDEQKITAVSAYADVISWTELLGPEACMTMAMNEEDYAQLKLTRANKSAVDSERGNADIPAPIGEHNTPPQSLDTNLHPLPQPSINPSTPPNPPSHPPTDPFPTIHHWPPALLALLDPHTLPSQSIGQIQHLGRRAAHAFRHRPAGFTRLDEYAAGRKAKMLALATFDAVVFLVGDMFGEAELLGDGSVLWDIWDGDGEGVGVDS